jgi:hypothetical protein
VPLNYKHDKIKFNIKPGVSEGVSEGISEGISEGVNKGINKGASKITVFVEDVLPGKKVLDAMYVNYMATKTVANAEKGTDSWYQYCGIVLQETYNKYKKQIKKIADKKEKQKALDNLLETSSFMDKFIVHHIVDTLLFQDRIDLMNYLQMDTGSNKTGPNKTEPNKKGTLKEDDFISLTKEYLNKKTIPITIKKTTLTCAVVFDGPSKQYKEITANKGKTTGNLNLFILKSKKWVPAEPEDKRDLEQGIIDHYKLEPADKSQMNERVGFIGFETNQKDMVFKIKDTENSRSSGYQCIQAGKGKKILDILDELEKEIENPVLMRSDKDAKESVFELCIRIELLLRIYQDKNTNGKTWFIDTETAIFNQFEKKEKA